MKIIGNGKGGAMALVSPDFKSAPYFLNVLHQYNVATHVILHNYYMFNLKVKGFQ